MQRSTARGIAVGRHLRAVSGGTAAGHSELLTVYPIRQVRMLSIELSPTEAAVLRDVLDAVISDLGMEIAGTDSHDFRESLKERREVLRRIAEGLGQRPSTA